MAAGGIQALWKGHRALVGRRAVVAGTGPFLLPVAAGLVNAGAEVVAICEAGNLSGWLRHLPGAVQVPSKGIEGVDYVRKLLSHRVPYRRRTVVTAIHGDLAVRSVTLSRVDASGRALRGAEQTLEVDLVGLGWGFTPSLELVIAVGAKTRRDVDQSLVAVVDDDQRSTVPGVYVAGEATGIGGARLAAYEGELAALTLVEDRGQTPSASRQRQLRRAIRRARAFARAMHLAHPIPTNWPEWLAPDTTICRCEEVDYAAVCRARDELGAVDARMVKLLARTGMGWCQGRVCGFATSQLAVAQSGREVTSAELRSMSKRPFAVPVSLGELADLDES
jgi:NADP-dependent aldehyde dehydrogenase